MPREAGAMFFTLTVPNGPALLVIGEGPTAATAQARSREAAVPAGRSGYVVRESAGLPNVGSPGSSSTGSPGRAL